MLSVFTCIAIAAQSPKGTALLDDLQHRAVEFFWNESNPENGFSKDRAANNKDTDDHVVASCASVGFALPAYAIGVERHWLSRADALKRTRVTLNSLNTKWPQEHGWLYHFVDWKTGAIMWNCEASSIDTSICLAGVVIAKQYWNDPEVTREADAFIKRIDWKWMLTNGDEKPDSVFLNMGWKQGNFLNSYWDTFDELKMIYIQAYGFSDITNKGWDQVNRPYYKYKGINFISGGPLFAARELGYRPNAVARTLVTKRSDMIAVVFQRGDYFSTWSAFTSELMRGVSAAAVDLGLDLMLHTKHVSPEVEGQVLCDGRVDGALVLRDEGDPILKDLAHLEFPCVQFFSRSEGGTTPFVDADNYAGGRMATRHLIDLGHRRIAMIRGSLRSTSSNDRYNGYRDALEGAGIGVAPERVLSISPQSDVEPFRRLMSGPNRPTAIFVWSDEVAFTCMDVLKGMGLRIPEDVSIVGFDSLDACNLCSPPLTSVRQPVYEMAYEATRLLSAVIRGETLGRNQVLFSLSLDVRGSTAQPG